MLKLPLFCIFVVSSAYSQVVNNVRVINHGDYIVNVISETVREVERREWCNLKFPDISEHVDEHIMTWHMTGDIHYSHVFVTSIEHVDVLQSSLNQIWSNVGDGTVQVEIRGQLRMTNLALGFDVVADLLDSGRHQYTGVIVHPLITFNFSVFRNAHTNAMSVAVTGTQPFNPNTIRILPVDRISDAISQKYDNNITFFGVTGWSNQVFQPIALNIVTTNSVPFPGFCYDCPA